MQKTSAGAGRTQFNCDGGKKESAWHSTPKTIYDAAKVPHNVFGVNVRDNLKFNFQHSFGAEWICDPLEELNKIVDQANSVKASVESMIERMGSLGEEIFETIFNFDQLKATLQNTVSDLLGSFGAGAAASPRRRRRRSREIRRRSRARESFDPS